MFKELDERGEELLNTSHAKELVKKLQNPDKNMKNYLELLSSMEDVYVFLKWIEPSVAPEVFDSLKLVLGVSENEGHFVEVDGIGKIDIFIASIVKRLNLRGYETLASCSGLLREHPNKEDKISGYISFLYDKKKSERVEDVCNELNLPYEEGETYFKPSFTVRFKGETDREIEEKWIKFENSLLLMEGSDNE